MTLPELELQFAYARLAWGAVLAALIVCAALGARRFGSLRLAGAIGLTMGVMWLPGQASPAHWLGLAFQSPSALLTALCVAALVRRARHAAPNPAPLLPPWLACCLGAVGALLYADATGWVLLGVYPAGFGSPAAPAAASAIGLIATGLVLAGRQRETGAALLAAAALFAFARLPSGNLFDAMLDPFLWCWAVWAALARVWAGVLRWPLGRNPAP